jgi:hypothetical protein
LGINSFFHYSIGKEEAEQAEKETAKGNGKTKTVVRKRKVSSHANLFPENGQG